MRVTGGGSTTIGYCALSSALSLFQFCTHGLDLGPQFCDRW